MRQNEKIRVGTRDSQLAIWQTKYVITELSKHHDISFEIISIKSTGDQALETPFEKLEGKGFFTKELDQALLENKIDIAVHSLKDIPTELAHNLEITAIDKRHDPRDVLIGKQKLDKLPHGATLATGSLRRKSQLLVYRPDLNIVGLRGNLQTRYKKFNNSNWDGMILAGAGVDRLKMSNTIEERIPLNIMVPAVGQGSLGVITRKNDFKIKLIVKTLDNNEARVASLAERSFLSHFGGGCTSPIACHCQIVGEQIYIEAFIGNLTGDKYIQKKITATHEQSRQAGIELAKSMLTLGAHKILGNHQY